MYKKELIQTIEWFSETLQQETNHLSSDFSNSHLRLRRVSLKTYKTLIWFMFWAEKNTTTKPFSKELKKLYRQSGEARKWLVCKRKAKGLEWKKKQKLAFDAFCIKKSKQEQLLFEKLFEVYDSKNIDTLFSPILAHFKKSTKAMLVKECSAYKKEIVHEINIILAQDEISDDGIHDIRKLAKHLLYFSQLFQDGNWEKYTSLSKLLGRRNDSFELHLCLKLYNKKLKKASIKHIIKSLRKQNALQKEEIIIALQRTFS